MMTSQIVMTSQIAMTSQIVMTSQMLMPICLSWYQAQKISKSKIFRVFSRNECEVSVRPLHHTRKNPGKFRRDDVTDTPANLAELPFMALLPTPTSPSRTRAFAGRTRAFDLNAQRT